MLNKIKELYIKYKELINYLVVGVMTTVVSLVTYYGCVLTFLDPNSAIELQIANIISWVAAVTFAYFTNRKFVFESTESNMVKEAAKFYASRLSTLGMDMVIMFVGVTWLGFSDKIMKLVVQVVVTIANYVISKFLVFKKEEK